MANQNAVAVTSKGNGAVVPASAQDAVNAATAKAEAVIDALAASPVAWPSKMPVDPSKVAKVKATKVIDGQAPIERLMRRVWNTEAHNWHVVAVANVKGLGIRATTNHRPLANAYLLECNLPTCKVVNATHAKHGMYCGDGEIRKYGIEIGGFAEATVLPPSHVSAAIPNMPVAPFTSKLNIRPE